MVGQQDIWFLAGKHLDMAKESQISQSDNLNKALKWVDQCTHLAWRFWETNWAGGGRGVREPTWGEGVRESTPQKLSFLQNRALQRLRPSPLMGLLQDFSKCGLGIMVFIAPLRGSVFIKGQGGLLIGKRGGGNLSLWNSWMLL